MVEFLGCKYLIFDKTQIDPRCKIVALPGNVGAYWKRDKVLLLDEYCSENVQFCSKRGRLNSKASCLHGIAECSLYSEKLHSVDCDE